MRPFRVLSRSAAAAASSAFPKTISNNWVSRLNLIQRPFSTTQHTLSLLDEPVKFHTCADHFHGNHEHHTMADSSSHAAHLATSPGAHPVHSTSNAHNSAEGAPIAEKAPKDGQPKQGKKKEKKAGGGGAALELSPPPEFFATRNAIFDKYKAEYAEKVASMSRQEIEITLPDGKTKQGTSWETTPFQIAEGIAASLAQKVIIAKVDGELWDLHRPLEKSCQLALLDFDSPDNNYEARQVFWHSSAHVLGEACERHFDGCCLGYGPPQEAGGFFYEMRLAENRAVTPADYPNLEAVVKTAVKEKQNFERLELPKEALLEMFAYNPYKQHYIQNQVPDGTSSTVYRCGPLIDFCRGPHVPHTGRIKALAILKNSSSFFLADAKNDTLQRVYGISFPDSKQLTEYKKFLEEAEKRDHRRIGKAQELFMFHELSPGSAFFLPMGMRIYNTLIDFIKSEYRQRGYVEVGSPNIFNSALWKTSGHWQKYSEDMFRVEVDKEQFAIKPMNCPGHALIFGSRERSYKELPIRMAEFGVLHRNEASGALSGLTRVRRFVQDDAHIFCAQDQIESEISDLFDFLDKVYGCFGFTYKVGLSTRNPESFIGDVSVWDKAEAQLKAVLDNKMPGKWQLNEGDGAFYGPKIDIEISDALKRDFQCATIQLDFQLPERFELRYQGTSDTEMPRPVMIHRAMLGSVERFIGILTEHCAGNWPFWLSPRQVLIIPVAAPYKEYASEVQKMLWDAGLYAEADLTDNTLKKKVLNAEVARWNFILVVGEDEMNNKSVNVRSRDEEQKGRSETLPLEQALEKMLKLKTSRGLISKLE